MLNENYHFHLRQALSNIFKYPTKSFVCFQPHLEKRSLSILGRRESLKNWWEEEKQWELPVYKLKKKNPQWPDPHSWSDLVLRNLAEAIRSQHVSSAEIQEHPSTTNSQTHQGGCTGSQKEASENPEHITVGSEILSNKLRKIVLKEHNTLRPSRQRRR